MFFNKPGNAELICKIKKSPAAWWWHCLQHVGLTKSTVQSLMDSFMSTQRLCAAQSTFNSETLEVTREDGNGNKDFAADMDDLLSDLSEEEGAQQSMEFEGAKEAMMETIREKEDLDFAQGGDDRSRATNFSSSTGNSTHNTNSSNRVAVQKTLNKQLAAQLDEA